MSALHRAYQEAMAASASLMSGSTPEMAEVRRLKQSLIDIQKSLITAGYQTPAVTTGNDNGPYGPMYLESLDDHMTHESYKLEDEILLLSHLRDRGAWKEANQAVEQIAVIKDRGNVNPLPIGFSEGGVPGTSRANLDRRDVRMRYMGKTVHVTDQAAFIRGIANKTALDWETEFAMQELLKQMDYSLWHGDSRIDGNEYDGFFQQMDESGLAGNVIYDYRGEATSLAQLQDAIFQASRASGGFSRITDIYLSPEFEMQFDRDEVTKVRHMVAEGHYPDKISYGNSEGWTINLGSTMGTKVPLRGTAAFDPANHGNRLITVTPVGESADVPNTPALTSVAAAANATSQFAAGDAGDYAYAVLSVGSKGVSAPLFVEDAGPTTQIAVDAGERVTITITAPNDGKVKYYRIFRTEKDVDGSSKDPALVKYYLIGRVKAVPGVNTEFIDNNAKIAGCSDIALVNFRPEFIEYRELLPIMRRPLATLDTTMKFLLMEWGNLHVRAPIKHRVLRNVRPVPLTVGA